jgi:hypothetical protein
MAVFSSGLAAFYERLREFSPAQMAQIDMTAISYINELYGDETLKRLQTARCALHQQRIHGDACWARRCPTSWPTGAWSAAWAGSTTSSLKAHALEGARSILILRSWRESGGEVSSNIVWEYGHTTIPRHSAGHRHHRIRDRRSARQD